jgi:hypothetical protein
VADGSVSFDIIANDKASAAISQVGESLDSASGHMSSFQEIAERTGVASTEAWEKLSGGAKDSTGVIGNAFMNLGGVIGGEVGEIVNKVGEGFASLGEEAKTGAGQLTLAGIAIAAVGTALSELGSKDAQSEAGLKAAFDAQGKSLDDYSGQLEDTIKQQEQYGHSSSDTMDAVKALIEGTGDEREAFGDMGEVADLAAQKHESLADAANTVVKVLDGTGKKTLEEYGVQIQTTSNNAYNFEKENQDLAATLSGQAAASVDSFSGKIKVMGTELEDAAAKFGDKYGTAIQTAGAALTAFGTAAEVVTAIQTKNAVASLAAAAATTTEAATTKEATAAMADFDAAADANPFGVIVLAIAAVVAGVILLITHFKEVKEFVVDVADAIGDAFKDIGKAIEDFWNDLVNAIMAPFKAIANAFSGLENLGVNIPGFASGGIVTSPTLAMVGEAGPEAIIPLNQLGTGGSGSGVTYIYNISGVIGPASSVTAAINKASRTTQGRGFGYGAA